MHQNEWFRVWFFKNFLGRGSPSPLPRPLPRFISGFALGSGEARTEGEAREKALVAEAPLQTQLEGLRCSPNPLIVGLRKTSLGGCFYDSGGECLHDPGGIDAPGAATRFNMV